MHACKMLCKLGIECMPEVMCKKMAYLGQQFGSSEIQRVLQIVTPKEDRSMLHLLTCVLIVYASYTHNCSMRCQLWLGWCEQLTNAFQCPCMSVLHAFLPTVICVAIFCLTSTELLSHMLCSLLVQPCCSGLYTPNFPWRGSHADRAWPQATHTKIRH